MAPMLPVHGAVHGGWCWEDVARLHCRRGNDAEVTHLVLQEGHPSAAG